VLSAPACDVLFIYREAALVGPALIERLAKRLRVPMVYDLDDPVFLPYRSPMNGWFSLLKFSRKTYSLFRMSNHIIAINRNIAEHAARFNPEVSIIPNAVDIECYYPGDEVASSDLRLVWMGSHSTMGNLHAIAGCIRRLQERDGVTLCVIGSGTAALDAVRMDVRQWSAKTEVADLQRCHIGLVPLPDHPWNPWKFFYKTIQYMAVGLPVVARRVGSNCEIIQDGVNGFLVESLDEWHDRLSLLIDDPSLRRRMGAAARQTVVEGYSLQSQLPRVAEVFDRVVDDDLFGVTSAGTRHCHSL
jgi:hypothetical protein